MKKILIGIVAFLALQLTQPTATSAQLLKDISEIALMKDGDKTTGLILGDNMTKAVQIFGQPDNISDFYSEMDEETFKIYHYGANKLYFLHGKLDYFKLSQSGILVGKINGDAYKIGDKIVSTSTRVQIPPPPMPGRPAQYKTVITKTFHNYPLTSIAGVENGISYKIISNTYLKTGETSIDSFIQLLFDAQEQLIYITIIEP